MGVPEGEEGEQEIENLPEEILKANFPNLVKEIDIQVQEAQSPKQRWTQTGTHTPGHIIIKLPKIKDKQRLLKAAKEEQGVAYKGVPKRLSADFSKETLQTRRHWQEIFEVMKQGPTTKTALPSKAVISNRRADKVLPG